MATSPQPEPAALGGLPTSSSSHYYHPVRNQQPPMPPPLGFGWHFGEVSSRSRSPRVHGGVGVALVLAVMSLLLLVALVFLYSLWARRYRHMARSPSSVSAAGGPAADDYSGEPVSREAVVKEKGLTKEEIDRFPVVRVNNGRSTAAAAAGCGGEEEEDLQCPICLGGLTDVMKVLPVCGHGFHTECVDLWIGLHASCPLCRASLRFDPLQAV